MNIQIIGDSFNVSDTTKKLVEEKISIRLDKLLTKFAPEMKSALIRIQKDKLGMFKVNFDMNLPGKEHVYCQTTHKILKSALIDLSQQAERQIKKYRQDLVNYSLG
jgi:ribosome-associated translation inhibitor RaiA